LRGDKGVAYSPYQKSGNRLIGIGVVVLFHVGIIYALVSALSHRSVEATHAPIEAKIITEAPPPRNEPPPPPPPQFAPPPPAFVPTPEVNIERPPPVQSTAPTVVTTERPPTPPAPASLPVSIMPKLDLQRSREPEYPPQSRRLGEQGSVVLQVLVDLNGRVLDSKLVQSSGFDRLDQAALDGVKTSYRFIPGTVDGKPAQMWYTFKFNWKLR
jgi:protein TonB